jgi:hypothetical protein
MRAATAAVLLAMVLTTLMLLEEVHANAASLCRYTGCKKGRRDAKLKSDFAAISGARRRTADERRFEQVNTFEARDKEVPREDREEGQETED